MEYGKRLLKFEGQDRVDLNIIVHAVGSLCEEKDMRTAKNNFMKALRTNGVIFSIVDMIDELKKQGKI